MQLQDVNGRPQGQDELTRPSWNVLFDKCKKNDLFYQSICYPLRLLKNSSGRHLKWLACLKGPCFLYNSIACQTAGPNPSPKPFSQSGKTVNLWPWQIPGEGQDIRRSHCQPFYTFVLLSGSEHMLAPSWSKENCLVKIFGLLGVCFQHRRVITSNIRMGMGKYPGSTESWLDTNQSQI
jgi:hypothetical protein